MKKEEEEREEEEENTGDKVTTWTWDWPWEWQSIGTEPCICGIHADTRPDHVTTELNHWYLQRIAWNEKSTYTFYTQKFYVWVVLQKTVCFLLVLFPDISRRIWIIYANPPLLILEMARNCVLLQRGDRSHDSCSWSHSWVVEQNSNLGLLAWFCQNADCMSLGILSLFWSSLNTWKRREAGGVSQVVECLHCKCEALSSNP
jgi:hypothetical protein